MKDTRVICTTYLTLLVIACRCLHSPAIVCWACEKTARILPAPCKPVKFPEVSFQQTDIDILGLFEHEAYKCMFASTLGDHFSKWSEVYFTP